MGKFFSADSSADLWRQKADFAKSQIKRLREWHAHIEKYVDLPAWENDCEWRDYVEFHNGVQNTLIREFLDFLHAAKDCEGGFENFGFLIATAREILAAIQSANDSCNALILAGAAQLNEIQNNV